MSPRNYQDDVLQQAGMRLAEERAYFLMDRNWHDLNHGSSEHGQEILEPNPKFPIGSKVLKMKHMHKGKLDTKYHDKVYHVLAAYANRSYLLAAPNGKRLKRHVNQSHLRAYYERQGVNRVMPG